MKRLAIIVLTLLTLSTIFAQNTEYSAPEFMQSYYDSYSRNYLNSLAVGRGNTGAARIDNIENVSLNPAGFYTDHTELYFEFIIKPTADEIGHLKNNSYSSSVPVSFFGYGFSFFNNISTGLYYALPQSIEYKSFKIELPTESVINRKSKFMVHRLGFVNSVKLNNLSLGVDVQYDMYRYDNLLINGSTRKIDLEENLLNFNVGAIYSILPYLNVGLTYANSMEQEFDADFVTYDVTIPAKASAGISYMYLDDASVNLDLEQRFYSQMSDAYNDVTVFKLGLEQSKKQSVFRLGTIYIPEIFKGTVNTPFITENNPYYPENFNGGVEEIDNGDQCYLTIGYTLEMENFNFTLTGMQTVISEIHSTQLFISLGINVSEFDLSDYTPGRNE